MAFVVGVLLEQRHVAGIDEIDVAVAVGFLDAVVVGVVNEGRGAGLNNAGGHVEGVVGDGAATGQRRGHVAVGVVAVGRIGVASGGTDNAGHRMGPHAVDTGWRIIKRTDIGLQDDVADLVIAVALGEIGGAAHGQAGQAVHRVVADEFVDGCRGREGEGVGAGGQITDGVVAIGHVLDAVVGVDGGQAAGEGFIAARRDKAIAQRFGGELSIGVRRSPRPVGKGPGRIGDLE